MINGMKSLILLISFISLVITVSCEKETTSIDTSFDYDLLYKTWHITATEDDITILMPFDAQQPLPRFQLYILFTFYENKTMYQYDFGPADQPLQFSGTWSIIEKDRITITFDKDQPNPPDDYEIEIIQLKEDILKIKRV